MTPDAWLQWLDDREAERRAAHLGRRLRPVRPRGAVEVEWEGRALHLFSSNDYLGLSNHPAVVAALAEASSKGTGPRGSALVCGYTTEHAALEDDLSRLKGTERALLFPTGYAANMGVLAAFASSDCAIFSDALNHASIIDGIGLSRRRGAELHVYGHADVEHLASLLAACDSPLKLVVTDGLFSMDGDLAPLREIAALKEEFGFLLLVDEAHSTLVFGERGAGVAEHLGVEADVDLSIGTLSKACAGQGGFLAATHAMVDHVLNSARTFIFSTALPLPVVAAVRAAIAEAERDPQHRASLFEHVERFDSRLETSCESPIVPIVVGDADRTMEISDELMRRGFHIPGIRPPTVPDGSSRLRVALSAAHRKETVEHLIEELASFELV